MSGRIILLIALLAIMIFPFGPVIMGVSCPSGTLDGWDWIFSFFVPFYGIITAIAC